jgi:methylthioribose-1-phosphate isomerase
MTMRQLSDQSPDQNLKQHSGQRVESSVDLERLPQVVRWDDASRTLVILDQTRLPGEVAYLWCDQVRDVWDAIVRLSVRGAPAIGIAAAYGVCLAARNGSGHGPGGVRRGVFEAIDYLATSRPTAVNLFWALDRMGTVVEATDDDENLLAALVTEARLIHAQDRDLCAAIGRYGAGRLLLERRVVERVDEPITIITHCNAGALATGGQGTALSPIYELHGRGRAVRVFADETRPLLQGSRLTAWELRQMGVPVTVMTDSMAGWAMRMGMIDAVIVGADRITAGGDVANKIGTYPLAILARHHDIPFFVAAPHSTFDMSLSSGDQIPIEHRGAEEVINGFGRATAPDGCPVFNPAFDVTPAELITAIITDHGVIESPSHATVGGLIVGDF